jgi:tRNA threonylcarbamoyladenosine biosynthesis protein TsaE
MSWSRLVDSPTDAAGDALDLRAAAVLDDTWAAAGFEELVPGELVRPVPQQLESPEQTRALGARLAMTLGPGDLVVLSGPLGAGKTALTQGIGVALGVRGAVTSPTFVLARVHRGHPPLVHVDAYRMRDSGGQLDDLDLDEDLERSVVVVEWGEGLVEGLSDSRLEVHLDRPAGAPESLRTAVVRARGPRWALTGPQGGRSQAPP